MVEGIRFDRSGNDKAQGIKVILYLKGCYRVEAVLVSQRCMVIGQKARGTRYFGGNAVWI